MASERVLRLMNAVLEEEDEALSGSLAEAEAAG